jgi:hypothetical protein
VPGVGQGAEHRVVAVRLDHVDSLAVAHRVLAADDVRQVDRVGGVERAQLGQERRTLLAAWRVFEHRLVGGDGYVGDGGESAHVIRVSHRGARTFGRFDKE